MTNESSIDKTGFDMDDRADSSINVEPIKTKYNDPTNKDESGNGESSATNAKTYIYIIIALGVLLGLSYLIYQNSNSSAQDSVKNDFSSANSKLGKNESNNSELITQTEINPTAPSISSNKDGITVNGKYDVLATALLAHYPTKDELRTAIRNLSNGDANSQDAQRILKLVQDNQATIRDLKQQVRALDPQQVLKNQNKMTEILGLLEALLGDVKTHGIKIKSLEDSIKKLNKNSGWYHNRLSILEGKPIAAPSAKQPVTQDKPRKYTQVRRVELNNIVAWKINGASKDIAFLVHKNDSSKKLRVTRGFEIPGCGQVIDINPAKYQVTTTSCVIRK